MAEHFYDTSAAVKHHRAEPATARVGSLLADPASRHYLSTLGVVGWKQKSPNKLENRSSGRQNDDRREQPLQLRKLVNAGVSTSFRAHRPYADLP
jgi:hypothetical protein